MTSDLFKRYVWLIDVVNQAGKLTYEEISNLWEKSPLNEDHSPMALRTFHNHREVVESLFGIRIACNRKGGNYYYIEENDNARQSTRLKIWMLQTLSSAHAIDNHSCSDGRVILNVNPDAKFGLTAAIEAIEKNLCVRIINSVPMTKERNTIFIVEPYCVRFWGSSWYLLGKRHGTQDMLVFDLSRVLNIEITEIPFVYDKSFDPAAFFRNYYGMDINTGVKPVTVRLRIGDGTRDLIRTQMLHESQKEIMADFDASIFEYNLVPGEQFKRTILSMGDDAEVICPQELREEMTEIVSQMMNKYAPVTHSKRFVGSN